MTPRVDTGATTAVGAAGADSDRLFSGQLNMSENVSNVFSSDFIVFWSAILMLIILVL